MKSRSVDQEKVFLRTAPQHEPEATVLAAEQAKPLTLQAEGVSFKIAVQQPVAPSSNLKTVPASPDDSKLVEIGVQSIRQQSSRPLHKKRSREHLGKVRGSHPREYEDPSRKKLRVFSANPKANITLLDLCPEPSPAPLKKDSQSSV